MTDYDPRLVDVYDQDNPDGPDHDFYRGLAGEASARSVVDLGCGTGILTVTLASVERSVVGVDPSASMIGFARNRPGAAHVDWVVGDSRSIPGTGYDFAAMTGNVVQAIPGAAWPRTLRDLRLAMGNGGTLAFESRNPAVRAWDNWAFDDKRRDSPHGPLIERRTVSAPAPGVVELQTSTTFAATGECVDETQQLAFRDRNTITRDVRAAGFAVEATYGDWIRTPFTDHAPIMVFVCRAV